MYESTYKDRFEQPRFLAQDATLCKTNISRTFEEPVRFIVMGLFDVDAEKGSVRSWLTKIRSFGRIVTSEDKRS